MFKQQRLTCEYCMSRFWAWWLSHGNAAFINNLFTSVILSLQKNRRKKWTSMQIFPTRRPLCSLWRWPKLTVRSWASSSYYRCHCNTRSTLNKTSLEWWEEGRTTTEDWPGQVQNAGLDVYLVFGWRTLTDKSLYMHCCRPGFYGFKILKVSTETLCNH